MSLESLRTPYMDIFYLHVPDHVTPLEETLQAVQLLYEGQSYLGINNNNKHSITEAHSF